MTDGYFYLFAFTYMSETFQYLYCVLCDSRCVIDTYIFVCLSVTTIVYLFHSITYSYVLLFPVVLWIPGLLPATSSCPGGFLIQPAVSESLEKSENIEMLREVSGN